MNLAFLCGPLVAIAASVGILLGLALGLNLYALPVPKGFGFSPEGPEGRGETVGSTQGPTARRTK